MKIKHVNRIDWNDLPGVEAPFFAQAEIQRRGFDALSGSGWIEGVHEALGDYTHWFACSGPQGDRRAALDWLMRQIDEGEFALIYTDSDWMGPMNSALHWSTGEERWMANPRLPSRLSMRITECLEEGRRNEMLHRGKEEREWWGRLKGKWQRGASDSSCAPAGIQVASSTQGISGDEVRMLYGDDSCEMQKWIPPRSFPKNYPSMRPLDPNVAEERRRAANDLAAALSPVPTLSIPMAHFTRKFGGSEDNVEGAINTVNALGGMLGASALKGGTGSAARQTGTPVVTSRTVPFRVEARGMLKHLSTPEGYSQKGGISGAHNEQAFLQEAKARGVKILSKEPGSTPGITTYNYQVPALNKDGTLSGGYKTIPFKKTVYDPNIYSDAKIVELGRSAAAKGYNDAVASGKQAYNATEGGVTFRVYLNHNNEVDNFHPQ